MKKDYVFTKLSVLSLILMTVCVSAFGQTIIAPITPIDTVSRNTSGIPSYATPSSIFSLSGNGSHKYEVHDGKSSHPSITAVHDGSCNGQAISIIKFYVSVKVPAHATYQVTHTFNLSSMMDGGNWGYSELQCYDEDRNGPDIDSHISFDATTAPTGVTYAFGRAYSNIDQYKKVQSCSKSLKYINITDKEQTINKYFIFISYAEGKKFKHTSSCELVSTSYYSTINPILTLEESFNYWGEHNPGGNGDTGKYVMSNLKNDKIWRHENSTSAEGHFRSFISNDNNSITIDQNGRKNKNSQAMFQIFSAAINIPANSDFIAAYTFIFQTQKTQTLKPSGFYFYELFDLGEDPNSMYKIPYLRLSPSEVVSDNDFSIYRKVFMNDPSFKNFEYPLHVRYVNRTGKDVSKKHYFAILLFSMQTPLYLKDLYFNMEMRRYEIFPTVSTGKINQFLSESTIGNMDYKTATGLMGLDSREYMQMRSDPRTISLSSGTTTSDAHMGYVPFTLTETLDPGYENIYKLYEYRTILKPGSFTGSGWQTVELFNFGTEQPADDNKIDVSSNTAPSNGRSLFKLVNKNPNDSIATYHRVVIPYDKKGNKAQKEFVDNNLALITSTPATGSKKPAVENRMTESHSIAINESMWLDMSESLPINYKLWTYTTDELSLKESSATNKASDLYVPFRMSMFLAPRTSIWKIVTLDLGIKDENITQSNAYLELLNFGDKDRSSEITLNKESNDKKSDSQYSEYRLYSKWGYHWNHRTIKVLMHFENSDSVLPSVVSNHMALLMGTNYTNVKHQFYADVKVVNSTDLKYNPMTSYDPWLSTSVFVDSWQEEYGYYNGDEDDKCDDIRQSDMKLEGDAFANGAGGGDLYAMYDEPTIAGGLVQFFEQVNNGNNARLLKFTIAAVVPPHSTLDSKMAAKLYARQLTDANPEFSTEMFYFGDNDHCEDLVFNVIGKLGVDDSGNTKFPQNHYPSDYAYSLMSVFGHTAYQIHSTNNNFDAHFVNDTDQPKLVRHYMGILAYCQYADKEHPWYKFWEDDKPLQHKLQVLASIWSNGIELNHDPEFDTETKNVNIIKNDDFNAPVIGHNSISLQNKYFTNGGSAVIEFDMAHTVQASTTDSVNLKFTAKNLNRNPLHLTFLYNNDAKIELYYRDDDGNMQLIDKALITDRAYDPKEKTWSISLAFKNDSPSTEEITRHFKLIVSADGASHLSLFRLDCDGSVKINDGDFSYELYKDSKHKSCAKIIGFSGSSVQNDILPDTCIWEGVKYPVKTLGEGALKKIHNKYLHIPGTMDIIESGAFVNCDSLMTMEFDANDSVPCTVYANHNIAYIDDNLWGAQMSYSINRGSIVQGCKNLNKVIFNRTVNGAEPNNNSVVCSPFVTYTNKEYNLDDIDMGGGGDDLITIVLNKIGSGLFNILSGLIDFHIGTIMCTEFLSPVTEFVFTTESPCIGKYACMNAKKADIKFVLAKGDTNPMPHFSKIEDAAFQGTKLKSFDFRMADSIGSYAFYNTGIQDIEITPNVYYLGLQSIATDSLFNLKIDYSPTPLKASGGDRWGNLGVLDEGLDSYTCNPNEGEWTDFPVTFLKTLDIDRDFTLYNPSTGLVDPNTTGPFGATMFEQNLDYELYDIGDHMKRIHPQTFKSNNFEYFSIGNGVKSIGSEGMAPKTIHSLKIGTGLQSLEEHAFVCQDVKISPEFVEQLMEAIKEDALKDAWWNDFACVYSNSNFNIESVADYTWFEWSNTPYIHDIYCEAIANKQTTLSTVPDIFTQQTYDNCVLRYTSPGLTEHYPWSLFAHTQMVVPMDENQRYFKACDGEIESDTLKHRLNNVEIDLRRSYKRGWNTLCVPFDCTADALADGLVPYYMNNVIYNEHGGQNNAGSFDIDFKKVTPDANGKYAIRANVPYLVWFETDVDEKTITTIFTEMDMTIDHGNKMRYTVKDEHSDASVTMCGTYKWGTVGEGNFILSDGKFYEVDSYVEIKAFRAWFHADDGKDGKATRSAIRLLVNGQEINGSPLTDQDEIVIEPDDESLTGKGYYYDAFGRKVTNPVAGKRIYIRDGKKVLF